MVGNDDLRENRAACVTSALFMLPGKAWEFPRASRPKSGDSIVPISGFRRQVWKIAASTDQIDHVVFSALVAPLCGTNRSGLLVAVRKVPLFVLALECGAQACPVMGAVGRWAGLEVVVVVASFRTHRGRLDIHTRDEMQW